MAPSRSPAAVNWERLVRATLRRDRSSGAVLGLDASVQYPVQRATVVKQILQAIFAHSKTCQKVRGRN